MRDEHLSAATEQNLRAIRMSLPLPGHHELVYHARQMTHWPHVVQAWADNDSLRLETMSGAIVWLNCTRIPFGPHQGRPHFIVRCEPHKDGELTQYWNYDHFGTAILQVRVVADRAR